MSGEGRRVERADGAVERMSYEKKTLWGFPVVITDAAPKGAVLLGRLPTWQEVLEHGSVEKALEAQKREWAMLTGIDVKE